MNPAVILAALKLAGEILPLLAEVLHRHSPDEDSRVASIMDKLVEVKERLEAVREGHK